MVLIPSQKWTYIYDNWQQSWVDEAKASVQLLWDGSYKPTIEPIHISDLELDSMKSGFEHWAKAKQQRHQPLLQDEYVKYCQLPITPECDAKGWWMEPAQRTAYPNLHKMALDVLSIPAMSAEPERLFSGAKITITERRNRLGVDTIEYLECLKSWLVITDTPWAED
jgi:hypothetical protein